MLDAQLVCSPLLPSVCCIRRHHVLQVLCRLLPGPQRCTYLVGCYYRAAPVRSRIIASAQFKTVLPELAMQVLRPFNSSRHRHVHPSSKHSIDQLHRSLKSYHLHIASSINNSRSTVSCNSSSHSSNSQSSGSLDPYLSIVSASSWQQLYNIFYDHRNAPGCQQCYGILLQLSELLREMQLQQTAKTPGDHEGGWQALAAAGKVQTASDATALKVCCSAAGGCVHLICLHSNLPVAA